jgi:hypothetical protein
LSALRRIYSAPNPPSISRLAVHFGAPKSIQKKTPLDRTSADGADPASRFAKPYFEFFFSRFAAFFSAGVLSACFFVCFWEFCDLAMMRFVRLRVSDFRN